MEMLCLSLSMITLVLTERKYVLRGIGLQNTAFAHLDALNDGSMYQGIRLAPTPHTPPPRKSALF